MGFHLSGQSTEVLFQFASGRKLQLSEEALQKARDFFNDVLTEDLSSFVKGFSADAGPAQNNLNGDFQKPEL
jgi:hypothetical protein